MGPSSRRCHHNLDGVLISEGDNDAAERSSWRTNGPKNSSGIATSLTKFVVFLQYSGFLRNFASSDPVKIAF